MKQFDTYKKAYAPLSLMAISGRMPCLSYYGIIIDWNVHCERSYRITVLSPIQPPTKKDLPLPNSGCINTSEAAGKERV